MSEGLSRLNLPGSLVYALRPKGWGKTTLLHHLAHLISGGEKAKQHFDENTWIRKNKNILFRQPKMIPLILQLSRESLQQEHVHDQMHRQLLPSDLISSNDAEKMTHLLRNKCYADAISFSSKLHGGTRIALLVDDFDNMFIEPQDYRINEEENQIHLLAELCKSVEMKSGGGLLLMKGTFRPRILHANGLLQKMRDLSLDLHHSNTWGMSLSNEVDREEEQAAHEKKLLQRKGYVWNEKEMVPQLKINKNNVENVEVKVDLKMMKVENNSMKVQIRRYPFNYSGGYWFGGCRESTGMPEAVAPLRPWMPFSHRSEVHNMLFGNFNTSDGFNTSSSSLEISTSVEQLVHGVETLVSGTYSMSTMDRYLNETVQKRDQESSETNRNDWAVVMLQAGLLTMASRSMRFDEFHTYAWCRLSFPNEKARKEFVALVLKEVVSIIENRFRKDENGESHTLKHFQWENVQQSLDQLSNSMMNNNDEDGKKRVSTALQDIVQYSRFISERLPNISVDTCLKFLLLGLRNVHLDDQIGHSVADAGAALDTFSNKEDMIESISPKLKRWDMRSFVLDGRVALPSYVHSNKQYLNANNDDLSDVGNMVFYNQTGSVCGVLKL
jgi:hypothetical protein